MTRFAQSKFFPKNPQKYIGKGTIFYRSSWEAVFMNFCDTNDAVLKWASESIAIPYIHPLTGKRTNYIPDFFVVYQNKHGKQVAEVIEIKPQKETMMTEGSRTSAKNKLVIAINHAKWAAATAYCKHHGFTFRVLTENQIFHTGKPPTLKRKSRK